MNRMGASGQAFCFIISFRMNEIFLLPAEEMGESPVRFCMPGDHERVPHQSTEKEFRFSASPVSFSRYSQSYRIVREALLEGNSYLLNLTLPTAIDTNLTLEDIFLYSEAPYKLLFPDRFVVFSPETFVRIREGVISSYPMKGTIAADLPGAREIILNDPKETAEHRTIVDLIRNDLGRIAANVQVKKFRYLDKIETHKGPLLQVSSEITADLPGDYCNHIGDLLFELLPAGSVTGAPKKKTVEVILEAEAYERGFYTGIFGFFDGRNLDSAVMIRFIEQTADGKMVFKSGGGITVYSEPEKEYQELIDKVYVPFTRIR